MNEGRNPVERRGTDGNFGYSSNTLMDNIGGQRVQPGHLNTTRGTIIQKKHINRRGIGDKASNWAFGVTQTSSVKFHVEAGHFTVYGSKDYSVTADDVIMPDGGGSVAYGYVVVNKNLVLSAAPAFGYSLSYPVITSSSVSIPLIRIKWTPGSPGAWAFDAPGHILHRGNIMLSNNIVWG